MSRPSALCKQKTLIQIHKIISCAYSGRNISGFAGTMDTNAYLENAKTAAEKCPLKIVCSTLCSTDSHTAAGTFLGEAPWKHTMNSAPLPISECAVIGGGAMGQGIAMALARSGFHCLVVDNDEKAVKRCQKNIRGMMGRQMPSDEAETLWPRLRWSTDLNAIKNVDLVKEDSFQVIEAVFEEMGIKKEVFSKLDAICKNGAVLSTNTSGLDIDEIASVTSRPESVIGMHFFIPAERTALVEIVNGKRTGGRAVATIFSLTKRIGKLPVLVGNCPGFVANRMGGHYFNGAVDLVENEGFLPHEVDYIYRKFGFPLGPFQLMDSIGMDTQRRVSLAQKYRISPLSEQLWSSGRLGRKSGKGWYMYDPVARHREVDPEIVAMIRSHCLKKQRSLSDKEVMEYCLFPMVNEGFKLMESGMASRLSDIDLIGVFAYGWPLHSGGPMNWIANKIGIDYFKQTLDKQYRQSSGHLAKLDRWKSANNIPKQNSKM